MEQGLSHINHHHHVVQNTINKALIISIILNILFVLIEAFAGIKYNSLALLSDAGHNLCDVTSLFLIWIAGKLSKLKPNLKYTYGYGKITILFSLANVVLLIIAVGTIAWEAVGRLTSPDRIQGNVISIVAFAGIIINGLSAILFMKGRKDDLNIKGAFLHMASDALVSLGVMISGIIIIYTDWFWLDPAISLLIIIVIVFSTWGLLKESLRLSLDGVPVEIDLQTIRNYLLNQSNVMNLHDLHVWAMSTNSNALTVHLVVLNLEDDLFIDTLSKELHNQFNIDHSTIQIEKFRGPSD